MFWRTSILFLIYHHYIQYCNEHPHTRISDKFMYIYTDKLINYKTVITVCTHKIFWDNFLKELWKFIYSHQQGILRAQYNTHDPFKYWQLKMLVINISIIPIWKGKKQPIYFEFKSLVSWNIIQMFIYYLIQINIVIFSNTSYPTLNIHFFFFAILKLYSSICEVSDNKLL